jgi:hypothetical protein
VSELARTVGGPVSGAVVVTLPDPLPVSTTQLPAALVGGRLSTDGSGVTQPVSGNVSATIAGPLTAFGELQAVGLYPMAQGAFVYGINTDTWRSVSYGTGASVSVASGIASAGCGTSATGYSVLQSRRAITYHPGQGSLVELTAIFAAPVTNNRQWAGGGNAESGYYFGYNGGSAFGIVHVSNGTRAIQTLTITTKSSTAENVTVTLDGTPVSVAVTNGASTITTAWEIAQGNYANAGQGWDAQAIDSVVYFVARQCNAAVGTVSLTASTAVGVGAVVTAAVANAVSFTPQSAWNVDTLDGSGNAGNPSGMLLNPSLGNVYRIAYQYLGFGNAFFYVESQTTGLPILVNVIRNTNTRTAVVLRQPSASVRWVSQNVGSTTSVAIQGASGATFLQGTDAPTNPRFSTSASRSISSGTLTPVLSIMLMRSFQNRASRVQVTLTILSFAGDGSRPTVFTLYRDPVLAGTPNFIPVNANVSSVAVDTASTGVSGGVQVFASNVGPNGSANVDLAQTGIAMLPGEIITVAAQSANANNTLVTLAWSED